MKEFRQLAGQTLIYGLGTMLPKFLNYFILTFYFTRDLFAENAGEYGKVTELYAYISFIMIILTFGMETTYFRYVTIEKNREKIFSTIFTLILISTGIFALFIIFFHSNIARFLKYSGEPYFIILVGLILGVEALTAIPFARLRIENKAKKFALLKIIQVLVNIGILLSVYNFIPKIINSNSYLLNNEGLVSAKFIFIANLCASIIVFISLYKEILCYKPRLFDKSLVKPLLIYGLPLMASGLAGTINETLDRSIYKYVIKDTDRALYELGIYGANYKIGGFLLMFIQMFRYAAEPFFFNKSKEVNSKDNYIAIMNVFVGIILTMALFILLFLDVFKYFIGKNGADYHDGIVIVPYIVLSYVFYGILFNLSIWYKLSNKTKYAFLIMITGAVITIVINYIYVPVYSYMACAVGHAIAYAVMVLISWSLSKKYYYIKYNYKRIGSYFGLAFVIYIIQKFVKIEYLAVDYLFRILMVSIFAIFVIKKENLLASFKRK